MSSGCHRSLLAAFVDCVVLWAAHYVWNAIIINFSHHTLAICTTLKLQLTKM